MLVPDLAVSSAVDLVRSCSLEISSLTPPAAAAAASRARSALTASSLSEASSGFQWPLPAFCFLSRSCLCFSGSRVSSASVFWGFREWLAPVW